MRRLFEGGALWYFCSHMRRLIGGGALLGEALFRVNTVSTSHKKFNSLIFRQLEAVCSLPSLDTFEPSENQAMKKWKWMFTQLPPRETQAGKYEVILPIFPWACPGGRGFQKTGAYNHQTSCVVWLFPSWKQSSSKVAKGGLLKKAYGTTYHKILLISPPPPLVALNWLKERFIIMFYAWRLVKRKLVFSTNKFCVDSDKTSVKVVFCWCISERILYPSYELSP